MEGLSSGVVIGVTLDGDDALVALGDVDGATWLRTVRGLAAQPAPAAPELGPITSFGVSSPGGGFDFAEVDGRQLMVGMDGRVVWVALFREDGESPPVVEIAKSGIVDRRPGIAAAPEIGLAGVCFATGRGPAGGSTDHGDGVSFALIDSDGQLAAEPRVLAAGLADIGGCDVAWSGETFLVAWWEIDHQAEPERNVVLGQIINRGW
jgi:hypothetical protein